MMDIMWPILLQYSNSLGDSKPAEEFNQIERQDHEMIDIEKLINDWLEKAM